MDTHSESGASRRQLINTHNSLDASVSPPTVSPPAKELKALERSERWCSEVARRQPPSSGSFVRGPVRAEISTLLLDFVKGRHLTWPCPIKKDCRAHNLGLTARQLGTLHPAWMMS